MERLFLVDQTLDRLGSSDFEYLRCIVDAAASDERFSTTIGIGKRFRWKKKRNSDAARELFQSANVVRSFRSGGNRHLSWLSGIRDARELAAQPDSEQNPQRWQSKLVGMLKKYRAHRFRLKRRKQIARFACDCNRFFRSSMTGEFQRGDQVFFSNVSELELMGLVVFLANAPSSNLATWHLQFRHDLPASELGFDARGSLARKVRACFMASLSRVPEHDLQFYGISAELVEQYESLELAPFSVLPYPVSPEFKPTSTPKLTPVLALHQACDQKSDVCELIDAGQINADISGARSIAEQRTLRQGPVRMVVPVEVDAEGEGPLQRIVEGLWEDRFAEGQLQVVYSSCREKNWWSQSSPNPMVSGRKLSGLPAALGESAIEHLQGPLSQPRHRDLIRNSDLAVLLPGGRLVDNARSFGELLSCGKPVLVPAGSFMATKLQPSQDQHINSLRQRLTQSRILDLKDLRFGSANAPLSGGVVSFDRAHHPFCAEAEKGAAENVAVVRFRWHHPNRSHFVRIRCSEEHSDGSRKLAARVLPQRRSGRYSLSLFRLGLGADRVRFEFENAFDNASAAIRDLNIELFSVADLNEVRLGASGLIYADPMSIEEEIIEVIENLGHYQNNAENDSQAWWHSHAPQQTLEGIVGTRFYETLRDAA